MYPTPVWSPLPENEIPLDFIHQIWGPAVWFQILAWFLPLLHVTCFPPPSPPTPMYPSPTVLHQFKLNTPHVLLAKTEPQLLQFWPCSPVLMRHSFSTSHLPNPNVPPPQPHFQNWIWMPLCFVSQNQTPATRFWLLAAQPLHATPQSPPTSCKDTTEECKEGGEEKEWGSGERGAEGKHVKQGTTQ